MSKFSNSNKFKNFKSDQYEITTKISQNKLKKLNKKNKNEDKIDLGITDAEFESMMADNEVDNKKVYRLKIPNHSDITPFVSDLLNKKIIGQDLVEYIEMNRNSLTGIDLLNGLLFKQSEPSDINWIKPENYGLGLKQLFESNIEEQQIGLLMIQNYCSRNQFIKIMYKNSSTYLIRIMFQLFFTYEIFEEETYWKWQDYIEVANEFDDEMKKLLSIQTTDFFIILKTVFDDEELENEDVNEEFINTNRNLSNKNDETSDNESEKSEESDKIPEEQDFNLDDI